MGTCWDVVPDCQANPNNEGLPGLYIQENINDHRGSQDSWNLQVHGVSQGDVLTFDFQGNNDVTNLTTAFGTVSGSGNSWAVSVQEAPSVISSSSRFPPTPSPTFSPPPSHKRPQP